MSKRNKLQAEIIIDSRKITKTKNNALDLNPDVILSLLASGRRDPQNEQERIWLESIEETKAKGKGIDIPFNNLSRPHKKTYKTTAGFVFKVSELQGSNPLIL